ncbi:hypothetical protein GPALN_011489 [Globodera pallida]|nr:hypothetical protein GPALN_011489 [Globodera pallida]
MDFLFQRPPKPLQYWPEPPPAPSDFVKPRNFAEKHFGQWCRNLTLDRHVQCPKASPFHWYICCGDDGTECCFGIQTWAYVVFGSLALIFSIATVFWLYLGPTNYSGAKVVDTSKRQRQQQHNNGCLPAEAGKGYGDSSSTTVLPRSPTVVSVDDDNILSSPEGTLLTGSSPSPNSIGKCADDDEQQQCPATP